MFALLAFAAAAGLSPQQLDIATRVAGPGKPACTSTLPDGASAPCLPLFQAGAGARVDGVRLGATITFTRGALHRLTPAEFALLAGHEIAHYYLGHQHSDPASELAADRLGARYACAAGYDPAAGLSLFRFLEAGTTHPPRAAREAAVRTVRAECWGGTGQGASPS